MIVIKNSRFEIYSRVLDMQNILGKLVSGKSGYKSVIDKTKPIAKCSQCGKVLDDSWKFCPECGNKLKWFIMDIDSYVSNDKNALKT